MLCDRCKKNEATVHIKEFHNGKCTDLNLCSKCAAEAQNEEVFPGIGFNLAEVLMNVNKFASQLHPAGNKKSDGCEKKMICPVCGWDQDKLREHDGKVGCPACYQTFESVIKEAVAQVQRGSLHLGKRPKGISNDSPAILRSELESLQKELQSLIAKEEYEAAAVCRDRINIVKAELNQDQGE